MWYAAAAGWLALCGLAFLAYKRPSKDKFLEGVKIALAFTFMLSVLFAIIMLGVLLFILLPEAIFGDIGGGIGILTLGWLSMSLLLTDVGDSFLDGLKRSTIMVIVMAPILFILIGKV